MSTASSPPADLGKVKPSPYRSNMAVSIFSKAKQTYFLEQKTILLDLDETLVHSEPWISSKTYDVVLNMAEPDSKIEEKVGVFIRPFAHRFL